MTHELLERGVTLLLRSNFEDLGALSQPVVFLEPDTSLRDALRLLAAHRILSAPVLSSARGGKERDGAAASEPASEHASSAQLAAGAAHELASGTMHRGSAEYAFEGFCDISSILRHLLASLPAELLEDSREDVDVESVVTKMDALSSLAADVLAAAVTVLPRHDGDLVSRNFAASSLLDVVQSAFTHPMHLRDVAVCHRVAAADVRPELDSRASLRNVSPHSMAICSHMDIMRFLHARVDDLGALADVTLQTLGFAASDLFVVCVPSHLSALRALVELDEHGLSAAGVVNSAGELVANISVSDLRDVNSDELEILALPVLEFLAVQANCRRPRSPVTVDAGSSLRALLERFVTEDVHHVYVVDAAHHPVSVITPVDVLYLFDPFNARPAAHAAETSASGDVSGL